MVTRTDCLVAYSSSDEESEQTEVINPFRLVDAAEAREEGSESDTAVRPAQA
jgi:hypothetical protein